MPLIQSMVLLNREISSPAPQKRGCFYMAHGAFLGIERCKQGRTLYAPS